MNKSLIVILLALLLISAGFNIYLVTSSLLEPAKKTGVVYSTIEKTVTTTTTQLEIVREIESPYPMKIVDFMKREVLIKSQPNRIVSCSPSNTEILAALNLTRYIVGVDEYSDYPLEVKRLREKGVIENIGGVITLNVEKILELKPDIVFVSASLQGNLVPILEEKGLTIVALDANTILDVYREILLVGKIMNIEDKALQLVNNIREKIDYVQSKLTYIQSKKSVIYIGWLEPIWTTGSNTFLNDIIGLAGGYNLLLDSSGWFMTNPETIVTRNPEVIFITAMSIGMESREIIEKIKNIPGLDSVDAVQNNRTYLLYGQAENIFIRPGPRIGEAVELLAKILYPEIFGAEIPTTIGDEYTKYLSTFS